MKILHINNYHYIKGGSETVYLNTGKLLQENGHEVAYFSSLSEKNAPSDYEEYFIKPIEYNSPSYYKKLKNIFKFIYNKESIRNLEKLLSDFKPEIAHLHIFYGILTSSILDVLKKHNIPIVMSVHEYRLLCPAYTHINGKGNICEKCSSINYFPNVINRCIKGSFINSIAITFECYFRDLFFNHQIYVDKFIMVSDFVNKKHKKALKRIGSKSVKIYNFTDINYSDIHEKRTDFIYFGRLSKEKGLITLIEAFKTFPKTMLNIVGTGPQYDELIFHINKHNIENVKLLGYKSGNDLYKLIASSRFSIVPSEWYENNPLSIIESMWLGIPVIGANIGGIPELINKSTGILFESGSIKSLIQAIEIALNISDEEYNKLSISTKRFANYSFSKKVYYKKLISTYEDVIIKNTKK